MGNIVFTIKVDYNISSAASSDQINYRIVFDCCESVYRKEVNVNES